VVFSRDFYRGHVTLPYGRKKARSEKKEGRYHLQACGADPSTEKPSLRGNPPWPCAAPGDLPWVARPRDVTPSTYIYISKQYRADMAAEETTQTEAQPNDSHRSGVRS
jgi:hypothetical protein